MVWRFVSVALLAAVVILSAVFARGALTEESEWKAIAEDHRFDIIQWEFENFFDKWGYKLEQAFNCRVISENDRVQIVKGFLSLDQEIHSLRSALDREKDSDGLSDHEIASQEMHIALLIEKRNGLQSSIEEIIESQVSGLLSKAGLSATLRLGDAVDFIFPPVDFTFDDRLNVLIISSRERIDSIGTTLLNPDMTLEEKIDIERREEELGYSALVEQIGAVATYPSMIPPTFSVESLLTKVAHEWMHHYLFFRPLGQRYWSNYDMTTINETVANIAGDEIGSLTCQRFYGGSDEAIPQPQTDTAEPFFDFNKAMREIRITVDNFLAEGLIDEAEEYMNERRQFLEDNGFYIRKLNQAYFAFYGTYADTPSSVSPIGDQLRELRERSASITEFIETASQITSYNYLLELLEEQ